MLWLLLESFASALPSTLIGGVLAAAFVGLARSADAPKAVVPLPLAVLGGFLITGLFNLLFVTDQAGKDHAILGYPVELPTVAVLLAVIAFFATALLGSLSRSTVPGEVGASNDQYIVESPAGVRIGPLNYQELVSAHRAGEIRGTWSVRHSDGGDWKEVASLPGMSR